MNENLHPLEKKLRPLPRWIFMSRWLQAPLYIGLIVAQGVYVCQFWLELVHLISMMADKSMTETTLMLIVLGLIDVVMISNLLIMVIVGGYETFVSRLNLKGHPDEPDWLSHVNANLLEFFSHSRAAIAAEAQARLLLDMRQNNHVHVLPATGGAAAEGPQATRADIHHPAQSVDREGPSLFFYEPEPHGFRLAKYWVAS